MGCILYWLGTGAKSSKGTAGHHQTNGGQGGVAVSILAGDRGAGVAAVFGAPFGAWMRCVPCWLGTGGCRGVAADGPESAAINSKVGGCRGVAADGPNSAAVDSRVEGKGGIVPGKGCSLGGSGRGCSLCRLGIGANTSQGMVD